MGNTYSKIEDAKELIIHVINNGLSTDQEDRERADQILGCQSDEILYNLAHDTEEINGQKVSDAFYYIMFNVWPLPIAIDFYNENTLDVSKKLLKLREYEVALKKAKKDIEDRDKAIEARMKTQAEYCSAYQEADLKWQIAEREKNEAQQEVLTLKAKLYDLMTAGA